MNEGRIANWRIVEALNWRMNGEGVASNVSRPVSRLSSNVSRLIHPFTHSSIHQFTHSPIVSRLTSRVLVSCLNERRAVRSMSSGVKRGLSPQEVRKREIPHTILIFLSARRYHDKNVIVRHRSCVLSFRNFVRLRSIRSRYLASSSSTSRSVGLQSRKSASAFLRYSSMRR